MNINMINHLYGEQGTKQVYAQVPFKLRLAWDLNQTISRFQCHESIQGNVETIFEEMLISYGYDKLKELGLDIFGGCLNVRNMEGGSTASVHSWGLAIDLDPLNNQLKWGKDKAEFARPEYDKFWEIVERNGGYSLGRTKNYDWMHFQFIPITEDFK